MNRFQICPLLSLQFRREVKGEPRRVILEPDRLVSCIRNECQWWMDKADRCAIPWLAEAVTLSAHRE